MPRSVVRITSSDHRWVTRQMAEKQGREKFLESTLREMFFYIIFLILITIVAVGMIFPSMYYLTRVVHELFIDKSFVTESKAEIKFNEIRSAADFWAYAETALFDGFFWDHWYNPEHRLSSDDQKILYENKLIGVPRFRQLKVRNNSCIVHEYFRRMFLACYDGFSRESEDTEPFGYGSGTAWEFNSVKITQSMSYWGNIASYHGGGYYENLSLNRSTSENIIKDLKENFWITRGTRCVFLDFTIYNANLNLFCFVKLIFEFPPTGGVIPSSSIKTVKLIRYVSRSDYFILACEFLALGFIIYFTVEEIREITYFHWEYLTYFWNFVDLTILLLAYSCFVLAIVRTSTVNHALTTYLKVTNDYANFEYVLFLTNAYNTLVAISLFMVYIKVFKYLSFNKTMGQLNDTLHKCALDIIAFSVMFFIIFFAYAELGYLLFGTQVMGFSSFGIAMFTLLRTILGDFNYTEIEDANRFLAPIYFLTYIFFVFFVLLNMFLAIINDTYSDVKTELSVAPNELQMSEYIKRGFYNLLAKCGCSGFIPTQKQVHEEYNVTIEQIRAALRRCGFTDLEIEMFFTRYNIDPTAKVGEFDINKLMADLEGRPREETYKTGTSSKDKRKVNTSMTNIDDFIAQQERLTAIEKTISQLTYKVDSILKKLDILDNVKKGPVIK